MLMDGRFNEKRLPKGTRGQRWSDILTAYRISGRLWKKHHNLFKEKKREESPEQQLFIGLTGAMRL